VAPPNRGRMSTSRLSPEDRATLLGRSMPRGDGLGGSPLSVSRVWPSRWITQAAHRRATTAGAKSRVFLSLALSLSGPGRHV
jgi:hypothetical protein